MAKRVSYSVAQVLLGQKIEMYRKREGLTKLQLGKIINETEQQIGRFESGAFVPIATLEKIGKALNNRIEKRIIRRISYYRTEELESKVDQPDLLDLYEDAFPELEDSF